MLDQHPQTERCQPRQISVTLVQIKSGQYIRNNIKTNELVRPPETNSKSHPPKLAFQYPFGDGRIWEDLDKDGEAKNALSFEGTGLKI
jgi:hypothetical protein